eukprot:gnl/MRDRNA2_/MRDRNA2_86557_c0_seq8.p1 gnl/MRDRNA2_/MRDRNA2_86557_c0~~gnl/MRDRNA2_/MRDRNA2_86557_c0_seq8.p1  ORF type:complete len:104 (+),score=24.29 gnl/MRDRNA2_/MRDRNA2_86557_c0_seq8:655-966(+)
MAVPGSHSILVLPAVSDASSKGITFETGRKITNADRRAFRQKWKTKFAGDYKQKYREYKKKQIMLQMERKLEIKKKQQTQRQQQRKKFWSNVRSGKIFREIIA